MFIAEPWREGRRIWIETHATTVGLTISNVEGDTISPDGYVDRFIILKFKHNN